MILIIYLLMTGLVFPMHVVDKSSTGFSAPEVLQMCARAAFELFLQVN